MLICSSGNLLSATFDHIKSHWSLPDHPDFIEDAIDQREKLRKQVEWRLKKDEAAQVKLIA